jgi:hypothetical protein
MKDNHRYTKFGGFLLLFFIILILNIVGKTVDILFLIHDINYFLIFIDVIYILILLFECLIIIKFRTEAYFYKLINLSYSLIALQIIYSIVAFFSIKNINISLLIFIFLSGIIGVLIWTSYLLNSKRVKVYFSINDTDNIDIKEN